MRRTPAQKSFPVLIMLAVLVSVGCSSLPGLRVLTGEDGQETVADRAVQSTTWVMADKTSRTDPLLIAAADRIEAANPFIDIIEIRPTLNRSNQSVFAVTLLYNPPRTDNSAQEQVQSLENARRMFEVVWQGVMSESAGSQIIEVTTYAPSQIVTLDNGLSYAGIQLEYTSIDRSLAQSYLASPRSLDSFFNLIVGNDLTYDTPDTITLYEGDPNHPMFLIPSIQTTNRAE